MPFPSAVTDPIEIFLKHRAQLVEFENKEHDFYQRPAIISKVYELRKNGDMYSMISNEQPVGSPADGTYLYVIPSTTPYKVLCAKMGVVDGHTSLTREYVSLEYLDSHPAYQKLTFSLDKDYEHAYIMGRVHYAGEMLFHNGRLQEWNNHSGHFRPSYELRRSNMLPYTLEMFPQEKFTTGKIKMRPIDIKEMQM